MALGAALAGGCGDENGDNGRAVTVKASEPLRVVATEYAFDPERVVVAGGAAGPLTITLDNRGNLAHNLKVFQAERELGGTPTFPGGDARAGTVRLRAGSYRMVCTVGNHEELGMTGKLEIR
jgi:plastocyanin